MTQIGATNPLYPAFGINVCEIDYNPRIALNASEFHGNAVHYKRNLGCGRNNKYVIKEVFANHKEAITSNLTEGKIPGKKFNKVLVYIGGQSSSLIIIPWLREVYLCEVVCFTADIGQGIKKWVGSEENVKACGASGLVVKDLKEEFVKDFMFPCLRAGALYERESLLTSMALPLIAKGSWS